jgi:hypothetical protein
LKFKYNNGEEYYTKLYIFFNASIAITLLPIAFLLLKKQAGQLLPLIELDWITDITIIILLLMGSILIFISSKNFKQDISQISSEDTLRQKLDIYSSVCVKKYLWFLLAGILCAIGLFLTATSLFIIGYILSLIFLSIGRPTLNIIIEHLSLSDSEKRILYDKKNID